MVDKADKKDDKQDDPMAAFGQTLASLNETLTKLPDMVAAAAQQGIQNVVNQYEVEQTKGADELGDDNSEVTDDDLEGMSRSQLIKHMDAKREKDLAKLRKELKDDVTETKKGTAEEKLQREYKELVDKEPLAAGMLGTMVEMAKNDPSLRGISINRLFKVAVAEHPEKAQELQSKLDEDKKANGEDNEGKKGDEADKVKFGGLTPTSQVGEQKENTRMSKEDASDKAWEQHMTNLPPGVLEDSANA